MELLLIAGAKYILPVLAILATVFGFRSAVKSRAETKAKDRYIEELVAKNNAKLVQAKAEIAKQQKTNTTASEVQHEVTKLDPGTAADKLRDKWSRD